MKMEYVNVGGVQTRCIIAGEAGAPVLMMIHGLALTAEIWCRNIDALAADHRVIAPDLFGHGFTRPPEDSGVDFESKLGHLDALLDVLEVDKLSLCGSSYGALICCLLYLRNPARIDRLIINSSGSCFNTADQLHNQIIAMQSTFDPQSMQGSTRAEWRARAGKNFFDPTKLPEEILVAAQLCYAQDWPAVRLGETLDLMADREAVAPYRVLERLEEIRCPTLVLWGRDDHGGNLESAEKAVARIPDGHIEVFDACGHYPMIEHSERFGTLVRDFLASPHPLSDSP
ncbi:MAG: alpha/beta hydrolase [Rhizobiaceae bacterium]|nr:MAG: alpha/beta hydrolase [Rhizobiaceae bacterium]